MFKSMSPGQIAFIPLLAALLSTGCAATPPLVAPIAAAASSDDVSRASGPPAPALPPGLYVQVIDGLIAVTNKGGTQNFAAGQFGFTGGIVQPPVVVPVNPGLKFTPPPVFAAPVASGATSGPKSGTVDCVVRYKALSADGATSVSLPPTPTSVNTPVNQALNTTVNLINGPVTPPVVGSPVASSSSGGISSSGSPSGGDKVPDTQSSTDTKLVAKQDDPAKKLYCN